MKINERIKSRRLLKDFRYKNISINKLSKIDLNGFQIELKENNSPSKANKTIEIIKAVFNYAHNIYDVPNNALILTKVSNKTIKEEIKVWSLDEFNSFIECVDHPIYKAFFHTLFWTGLRRGEAIALLKDDLVDDYLIINKSRRRKEKYFIYVY